MRTERVGYEFEHGLGVVIESAHDIRIDFVFNFGFVEKFFKSFEVSRTIVAKIIRDFWRVFTEFFASIDFAIEYAERVFIISLSASRAKFIEFIGKIVFQSGVIRLSASFTAHAVDIEFYA